jgi:hypothetical protein
MNRIEVTHYSPNPEYPTIPHGILLINFNPQIFAKNMSRTSFEYFQVTNPIFHHDGLFSIRTIAFLLALSPDKAEPVKQIDQTFQKHIQGFNQIFHSNLAHHPLNQKMIFQHKTCIERELCTLNLIIQSSNHTWRLAGNGDRIIDLGK